MDVTRIHVHGDWLEDELLAWAASAERHQQHPVARAILAAAEARGLTLYDTDRAQCRIGFGLTVDSRDGQWQIGSERFMRSLDVRLPQPALALWQRLRDDGRSWVGIARDGRLAGTIELQPRIRPEVVETLRRLRAIKCIDRLVILSGDQKAPTRHLARELGLDGYVAETLPEQKADVIADLVARGRKVCFVGDGINDAIAMKKAHVSVSLEGGSDIATDTAQILLMDGHLDALPEAFRIARDFHRNINTGFGLLLAPSVVGMAGAVLLNFGPEQAVLLTQTGLGAGLLNSLAPRLRASRRQRQINSAKTDTSP